MRPTTVDQMRLPTGRVLAYGAAAGQAGRLLPISFDQRRHVETGNRPGSWMAVAFDLPRPVTTDEVSAAWHAVIDRHGTLRTVFSEEDDLVLREVEVLPGSWSVPTQHADPRVTVRAVLDEACVPIGGLSHHLCLVEADGDEPDALVVGADHAHVDAWSLLVLMRDLLAHLDGTAPNLPAEPAPFAEHTRSLEERDPAPQEVHERWARIMEAGGGEMPTFPLDIGDTSRAWPGVVEVRDVLTTAELSVLEDVARARSVRLFPLAVSAMVLSFTDLGAGPLRAVLPVHSRHEDRWHDSVGWFITNSVIVSRDPNPATCSRAVREAIELGSHALAPILAPYGGMPRTPGMFAISWLDNRRLPVEVDLGLRPQHVSAVIETDGVMVWFVLTRGGLTVRCRFPGTEQARRVVPGWLDLLCQHIHALVEDA